MLTFKEQVEALKGKFKSRITTEMSADEINAVNEDVASIEELDRSYDALVSENAKLKDTIVRMVSTEGNGSKPADESGGSKPKTIEECVAEAQSQQEGGK